MDGALKKYNFHDNKLHAISFAAEAENFMSNIYLDIDYIVQWPSCKNEGGELKNFVVSKAELIFFSVNNLMVNIDCSSEDKSIKPPELYIDKIVLEEISDSKRQTCRISMNDGKSSIFFDALSFDFHLLGKPISTSRQYLTKKERDQYLSLCGGESVASR